MTGELRHLCDAPVVIGVFQCLRDAFMFIINGNEAVLLIGSQSEVVEHRAVFGRLERLFVIEALYTLRHRIGHDGNGMVADHAVGLIRGQLPNRKPAAFFVLPEEGVDEIGGALAVDEGIERMGRTKGIPKGKNRVVPKPRIGVHLVVSPPVLPVDVMCHIGLRHGMVERGIEYGLFIRIGFVEVDFTQFLIPGGFGGRFHIAEIPAFYLRHVAFGTFIGSGRQRDLDVDFFSGTYIGGKGNREYGARKKGVGVAGPGKGVVVEICYFYGFAELNPGENILVASPRLTAAHDLDGFVVDDAHLPHQQFVAVVEIEDEIGLSFIPEGILVEPDPGRSRKGDVNVIIVKTDGIVTRRRLF